MKPTPTVPAFAALVLSLFLLVASHAVGAVVVNFTGTSYVAGDRSMNGWTSGTSTVAYSDTTYRYPTSNYDTTQPSAKFYGGATTTGANGITTYQVRNDRTAPAADNFRIESTSAGSSVSMFTFWKQADFVNLTIGNVSLTSSTNISLTILTAGSNRTADARLVIRQSGSYYVSEVLGSATGSGATAISEDDPTTLSWSNYDPFTDVSVIGTSITLGSFDGLTGIGILANGTSTATTPNIQLYSIVLNAVPEPSTGLLLGLGSGWLLLRRRRSSVA